MNAENGKSGIHQYVPNEHFSIDALFQIPFLGGDECIENTLGVEDGSDGVLQTEVIGRSDTTGIP